MSQKTHLPKWTERQRILHAAGRKGTPAELSALGERALMENALQDALEYFRAAGNQEGLNKMVEIVVREGDAFLLLALERSGTAVSNDLWNRTGEKALETGKRRFARMAFEKSKNEAKLAKLAGETDDPGRNDAAPPATV
ncbi:MAG: hypothetical protein V1495_01895 [Pseudomonadota bacterium]